MFASEEAAEGNATCRGAVDSQTCAAHLRLLLSITVVAESFYVNVERHHVNAKQKGPLSAKLKCPLLSETEGCYWCRGKGC